MSSHFRFFYPLLLCVFAACLQGHGLGVVMLDQDVPFDLRYTNRETVPVKIARVLSSCSCVSVLDFPREVASGETVELACMFRSDRAGGIAVQVGLYSTAEGAEPFAFISVEGVGVRPKWLVDTSRMDTPEFQGAWLLDTRANAVYTKLHAQGARSVPAYTLLARDDLKARRIVLYDEGHDPVGLLATVAAMRKEGFEDVYALTDGLVGWLRSGKPVQGQLVSRVPYASVSPRHFDHIREVAPWRILQIGSDVSPDGLGEAVRVQNLEEAQRILSEVEEGPDRRWLVLSNDRNDYEKLEVALGVEHRRGVFYLGGGAKAWAEHIRVTAAALAGTGSAQTLATSARVGLPAPRIGGSGCGSCGK